MPMEFSQVIESSKNDSRQLYAIYKKIKNIKAVSQSIHSTTKRRDNHEKVTKFVVEFFTICK